MCVILHINKEMLIEKWHLIVHDHKYRKRTIQTWISIPQKWAVIFIHNAVKKMHKRNWGNSLNHGNFKFNYWLQNRLKFWQHINSHVKFGITYCHYYRVGFLHLNVLSMFYMFYSLHLLYPISFSSLSDKYDVICWRNRHDIKLILSYLVYM